MDSGVGALDVDVAFKSGIALADRAVVPATETAIVLVFHWRTEFVDACTQLDRQTLQQRIDELLAKQDSGFPLSLSEKAELREALAAKGRR